MAITFYDLCGRDAKRFSPYGWRTRMALAHKGLDYDLELVKFTEKDKLAFSGQKLVPVIVDGDRTVNDSWAIAEYLEDSYPDRPSLFGSPEGRGMAKAINGFVNTTIQPLLAPLIIADILEHVDPADLGYFDESRRQRFGRPLAEVQADRDAKVDGFRKSLEPYRIVVKDRAFVGGDGPTYADYVLFGTLQWARCTSAYGLVTADDPIHSWFERLLDLHDGLGRSEPAA
ncbi:glutathione S-transferase [Thalassobaculum fulvum]|uniref:Glutathione S-transferase n=1 Tax=Thalassobaculum fulvum TaxID=1633335 RepID=A0A919CSN9_9PROT|nr:glutathione S-transferase family protein [Thalassobaculum fulvum]GHD63281.1 glutathione S-transferase [Thalassobaculum fulvum]